jgi:hypothetical protein
VAGSLKVAVAMTNELEVEIMAAVATREIKVGKMTVLLDSTDLTGDLTHINKRLKVIREAHSKAKAIHKHCKGEARERYHKQYRHWKAAGKTNKHAQSLARLSAEYREARSAEILARLRSDLLLEHTEALKRAKALAKLKEGK